MAASLTDELADELQGGALERISGRLGLPQPQAATAIRAALPLLLGALGRNASQPHGAQALFDALQSDHAGTDLGSVLGAALGGGGQGEQILAHVFGSRQARAEDALGTATGLGGARAGQLLRVLAPLVLAYLARRLSSQQGAASPAVLGDVLGQEQARVVHDRRSGLLEAVFDRDGDGQLGVDDLVDIGRGLLGGPR